MANPDIRVFSRSNVAGSPYLWRPVPGTMQKKTKVPVEELVKEHTCDGINDFETTYVTNRIWIPSTGSWTAPLYVQCFYVE
jgi:hypothetical protein